MRLPFLLRCMCFAAVLTGLVGPLAGAETPAATPAASTPVPPGIRLILPPIIYAVPGIEANLYFDNVCLVMNSKNYAFDVDAPRGRQEHERWTYVPAEKDVGDYELALTVRNEENVVVATAKTRIRVIPANAGADQALSLLCIGDSLTNASVYPQRIWDSCQTPGNPKLTLIGSHGPGSGTPPGPVRHEGYGGWTAHRFAVHFLETARTGDARLRGSPFLYAQPAGAPKLDFKRYCDDVNGGKFPDRVTIFLGCNDLFSCQDNDLESRIDGVFKYYDQLVDMVRTSSPSTRIGTMMLVPPTASQDAFGINYANGQTRWQYRRNTHRFVERMQEHYGNREADNIDLIPTHINLDCEHNYPTSTELANSRATEKITRQNNSVHPAASGYQQIGDTVYCWLKATTATSASAK